MANVDIDGIVVDIQDPTPEKAERVRQLLIAQGKINASPKWSQKAAETVLGNEPDRTIKQKANSVWQGLAVPEQESRQGLNEIAKMMPSPDITGNTAVDIVGNTPRIAAETMAEVAPSFISRESLVGSAALRGLGAAAPAIKKVGGYIGNQAERLSGLTHRTPGVLSETAQDPSLFVGPGKEAARKLYSAVADTSKIRDTLKEPQKSMKFVKEAWEAAKSGNLQPDEALEARKVLDELGDKIPDIARRSLRTTFDSLAKQKFSQADEAFSRAVKSEALRSLLPLNQSGTASQLRSLVMGGGIGAAGANPATLLAVPAFSPIAQGSIAALLGAGSKLASPVIQNPGIAAVLSAIQNLRRD